MIEIHRIYSIIYLHLHGLHSPAARSCGNRNRAIKHDKHIHFVLLNFHPRLRKLNANGRKLNNMIAIMEPVWKKIYIIPNPTPPPPLEFPGPLSPNPSGISSLFGRWGGGVWIFPGTKHYKDLCYISDIPHLGNCHSYDFLCFKQIHELLGLERDHRCSKAGNIQE